MIINVKLTSNNLVTLGESKILLPEDEVLIQFTSDVYKLGTLIVSVRNGTNRKTYKTMGTPIDITPLCKYAGAIEIQISHIIKFEPVKSWRTEPLILIETDHGFEAIPQIEALKSDFNTFTEAVRSELTTIKSALRELAALVTENEKI